ncbi:TPA: hypothetical protein M3A60_000015 [Cronobacter sakazakii]|nr:hypothetical protein [Cronobacter sakazakii]HCC0188606.1 hypothetical protein [Cronobacter sakazakii]HCC0200655.1 hypothetical protein [Cronobacter sakazakii]HCC0208281.1 hypothetical protein [Cronobacter sakazakii]HCC0212639.1 hypothetical protein [Cronobacter sakazakii]
MSTISTEQAKDLRNAFECWQQDYDPVEDKEQYEMFGLGVVAMDELLALRKERERAEPVAYLSKADVDAGYPHILARKEYSKACPMAVYTAPPEPSFSDDSLPYDPQIAEYEQMMEAEQAQADTTAQQLESLVGKSVVPAGWKLVPIELTKEMRRKIHPFAEALCHGCGRQVVADCVDNVTASWNDMLAVAPEPCK